MKRDDAMIRILLVPVLGLAIGIVSACSSGSGPMPSPSTDRFAEYVWPPPPDPPRVRLVDILSQRIDVEGEGRMSKMLIGSTPRGPYDRLQRPMGVALDRNGRVLVADMKLGAVLRFDREGGVLDVFGTTGALRLVAPISVEVTREETLLVTDVAQRKVVELDADGRLLRVFGQAGDLVNPTDATLSRDGRLMYACDSKAHQVVVFDRETGRLVDRLGRRGEKPGEFNYPSSIALASDGSLFVVDQMNARVQVLSPDGEYLETLGGRGTGFGQFVRPKSIAIDDLDFVYVSDAAFNNVQIFNQDLELLTFVGRGGSGPGEFQVTGGVAADAKGFAVVDQLGKRVQVFRYLQPRRRGQDADGSSVDNDG